MPPTTYNFCGNNHRRSSQTTTTTMAGNRPPKMMETVATAIRLISLLWLISFSKVECSFFRKIPNAVYYKPRGVDLELPCITEPKNPTCYWLKNGNIVASSTKYQYVSPSTTGDCSLTITGLEFPKDNATWECQVPALEEYLDNPDKPWPRTEVVVLVKPSMPKISYDNLTNSPIADKLTEVYCRSSDGNPIPRLEWYLNDRNITENAKVSVDDRTITSTLSYAFKKKDNGSTLMCIAVHQTGQQSATQILNVQYKPYVSVEKKMYTVSENYDLEIECQVEANPEAKILWKPADNIDDSIYKVIHNKLLLRNITYHLDGKTFQCSAVNDVGMSETESVKLNVLYSPKLIDTYYPRNEVFLGKDIRLECKFIGNPKPIVRWNFIDYIEDRHHNLEPSPDNPGLLLIPNATYLNEGAYYCTGINYNTFLNKENSLDSKFIVNIVGKPMFINEKKTTIGYRGLDTKIEQTFCSDPPPEIVYWMFGSHRLDVSLSADISVLEDIEAKMDTQHIKTSQLIRTSSVQTENPTCFRVILLVTNTDTQDIRDYVLHVKNKHGHAEGIVTLQVNSPLSIAAVIAFSIIILIIVLAITTGIVLLRRRSSENSNKEHLDPEIENSKSEVQVPINEFYTTSAKNNGH